MTLPTLADWLATRPAALARGPVAVLFVEDEVEVASSLAHLATLRSPTRLAVTADPALLPPAADLAGAIPLRLDPRPARDMHAAGMNALIDAVPAGTWLHYAFNAEYLIIPFAETRSLPELLTFHEGERRGAMVCTCVDLYPPDLDTCPGGVDRAAAMFDAAGYFSVGRRAPDGSWPERQRDIHGGLRWRFEEHLPPDRLRLDRVALFRARPGLRLLPDHRLTDEEMNTFACPWHHNASAAIASFRVAKALARNPRSRSALRRLAGPFSTRFDWTSAQLMEAGFLEPGQWL